jgi:hypothetical protein
LALAPIPTAVKANGETIAASAPIFFMFNDETPTTAANSAHSRE